MTRRKTSVNSVAKSRFGRSQGDGEVFIEARQQHHRERVPAVTSEMQTQSAPQIDDDRTTPRREFEVFYDGQCPLCRREIRMLQRLDRRQRIQFTDIASPTFNAAALGKNYGDLMGEIHGRLPDGTWVTGVEVFRQLYGAVGFRWLVSLSRLPGARQVLDLGYRVFARNRLRMTGRCTESCRIPQQK